VARHLVHAAASDDASSSSSSSSQQPPPPPPQPPPTTTTTPTPDWASFQGEFHGFLSDATTGCRAITDDDDAEARCFALEPRRGNLSDDAVKRFFERGGVRGLTGTQGTGTGGRGWGRDGDLIT
jgi:hypothetical protein